MSIDDWRREAKRALAPRFAQLLTKHPALPDDTVRLYWAYLGLGPFEGEPRLRTAEELSALPCLDRINQHHRLCEKISYFVVQEAV